jgi:hypothetical protein
MNIDENAVNNFIKFITKWVESLEISELKGSEDENEFKIRFRSK